MPRSYPPEYRRRVIDLIESGRSVIEIAEDLEEGGTIRSSHIRRIRPDLGLAPRYEEVIIGRKVRTAVTRGSPVTWDLLQ